MTYTNQTTPSLEELKHVTDRISTDQSYQIITLNHTHTQSLSNTLSHLVPEINIIQTPIQNQLILIYPKTESNTINTLISTFNKPENRIQIECIIYEISHATEQDLNLANTPLQSGLNLDYNTKTLRQASSLLDSIKALEKTGKAKMIARPTLILQNGQKGHLTVGEEIPYITTTVTASKTLTSLQQLSTGIQLKILATILSNQDIQVDSSLSISLIKRWKQMNDNEYPVLSSRTLDTSLSIPNKHNGFLGSFSDTFEKKNHSSVPFLSKIPFLGHLISQKNEEKSHSYISIFIKPSILN